MSQSDTQKRKRAERTREFLSLLAERYPQCFTRDPNKLRPLAIGIQKDLRRELDADPDLKETPNWLVRQALALYTRSISYKRAILEGRQRINLDGSDAGEIGEQEKAHASTELEKQQALRAERQREREQQRPRRRPRRQPAAKKQPAQSKLEALAAKFNKD